MPRARSRFRRHCATRPTSSKLCAQPTAWASSTATSNPRTFLFPPMAPRRSPTSAWLARSRKGRRPPRATCWEQPPISRPRSPRQPKLTHAPTCTPLASCSTRCSPVPCRGLTNHPCRSPLTTSRRTFRAPRPPFRGSPARSTTSSPRSPRATPRTDAPTRPMPSTWWRGPQRPSPLTSPTAAPR